jgi:hypothetical protein
MSGTLQDEIQTVSDNLTEIDAQLGKLESYGPNGPGSKMYPHSQAAHKAAGLAGQALDRAVKLYKQQPAPAPQPPNTGDVGDPQGHGPINCQHMTKGNWNYYQQHNLGAQWGQIFSNTHAEVNSAIGSDPGSIGAAPQDPNVPGGTPPYPSLATWG